nr:hypothetical protein CFP56_17415 [Quercus suber]
MGDGLGGTTNQSKAQTETAHRTTERKTARPEAGEAEKADRMNVSDMETAETEAQITPESHNKDIEINEVIFKNSKLPTCHFNSADFDAQDQEVDVALDSRASNVSFKITTTPHDSAKNVDPILNATPHDSLNIVEPKSNIASYDSATNTATLSPFHIAPNQIIQEHATHVTDSIPPPANKTARTWKRLARDNNMEAAIKQGPSVTKRNREEEMEILPELPSKKLQGLNVPNKVRNFMWRVCKEAIPAKHNLRRRKILNEDRCEQCGVEAETVAHALWNCSLLDEIWDSTPGFEDRSQLGTSSITDLIKLTHRRRKNVDLMAMVMWTIWYRRNQLRVRTVDFPKTQVLQQATQALSTFQQSQCSIINNAAVWGLPFDLMNLEAGKDISGGIGKVLDVDCKATDSNQAQFLRVRVEVPLNKLYRGVLLSLTLKQIRCGLPSNMSGYKVYVSTLED